MDYLEEFAKEQNPSTWKDVLFGIIFSRLYCLYFFFKNFMTKWLNDFEQFNDLDEANRQKLFGRVCKLPIDDDG